MNAPTRPRTLTKVEIRLTEMTISGDYNHLIPLRTLRTRALAPVGARP